MSAPADIVPIALHMRLQDLALTLRSTGAAEELEIIEAERDKLEAVSTPTPFEGVLHGCLSARRLCSSAVHNCRQEEIAATLAANLSSDDCGGPRTRKCNR